MIRALHPLLILGVNRQTPAADATRLTAGTLSNFLGPATSDRFQTVSFLVD
jgi:hypothetical protein